MLRFDWDQANIDHIAPKGITPIQVEQVIGNGPVDLKRELRNGEERLNQIGETNDGEILVVVTTLRGEFVRVVTAFRANRSMRQRYSRLKDANHAENPRYPGLQE